MVAGDGTPPDRIDKLGVTGSSPVPPIKAPFAGLFGWTEGLHLVTSGASAALEALGKSGASARLACYIRRARLGWSGAFVVHS
jgi:hypothetical protein